MLRVALLLTLLLFILAGCGNAYMEGRWSASNNQDSSGDRENKVASIVSGMSVRDMVGQMFVVSVGLSFVGFFLGLVATMLSTVAWLVGVALLQARLNAVWRCDPLLVEAPGERRSVAPAR